MLRKQQRLKTHSVEDLLDQQRKMNSSHANKPRYLFGETATLHSKLGNTSHRRSHNYFSDDREAANSSKYDFDEEIFLNKSGWVQVKLRTENSFRRDSECNESITTSKLDELILRNEARRNTISFYQKDDPSDAKNTLKKVEKIPVLTPIISPPPAFQDNSPLSHPESPKRIFSNENQPHPNAEHSSNHRSLTNKNKNVLKDNPFPPTIAGGIYSKSFEHDDRSTTNANCYPESYSKSFDSNLTTTKIQQPSSFIQIQRERFPTFRNLTGSSPNYLTKSDKVTQNQFIGETKAPSSNNSLHSQANRNHSPKLGLAQSEICINKMANQSKSRISQLANIKSSSKHLTIVGRRLNACDSDSNSGVFKFSVVCINNTMCNILQLSFTDVSNEDDHSSSLALSYRVPLPSMAGSTSPVQKPRSLTPDHTAAAQTSPQNYQQAMRKQRSLTPERNSFLATPEDIRPSNLENKQQKHIDYFNRSFSSSSSSSDQDMHQRKSRKNKKKQHTQMSSSTNITTDLRIRRSRYDKTFHSPYKLI